MNIWKQEPALLMAAVQAMLGLGTSFGLGLTNEQVGGILALSAAILGIVVRSRVTPGPVIKLVDVAPAATVPVQEKQGPQ